MNKLYLLYVNNSLYAYTLTKDFKDKFLQQRNPNVVKCKSHKVSDEELSVFMNNNKSFMLVEIPLYDGDGYCSIIGTINEDYLLSDKCDTIVKGMDKSYAYLKSLNLKKKYDKMLDKLHKCSEFLEYENGNIENVYTINTLYLFRKLFGNTFDESYNE